MGYDIYLLDRISRETIELPVKHLMTGSTYRAIYDPRTDTFIPTPSADAWLSVTYNYSKYYYEATEGDPRFAHDEVSAYYADGTIGSTKTEYGIRGIYGKTGAESIPMLYDMISKIEAKYKNENGEWISTERTELHYIDKKSGKNLDWFTDIFQTNLSDQDYDKIETIKTVSEGPSDDYWEETAGNAIKPLYQLIAFAELRPDGIWDGD